MNINPETSDFNIVSYHKGVTRTRDIIPHGEYLDKSPTSIVYKHRDIKGLVIKTSYKNIQPEYELDRDLIHPNLVNTIALYKKIYSINRIRYELVLKEIVGIAVGDFFCKVEKLLECKSVIEIIRDVQNMVKYLFDKELVWKDLNHGNIFITPEQKIMILDLERWEKVKNLKDRMLILLEGSNNIIYCVFVFCTSFNLDKEELSLRSRFGDQISTMMKEKLTEIKKIEDDKLDSFKDTFFNQIVDEYKLRCSDILISKI